MLTAPDYSTETGAQQTVPKEAMAHVGNEAPSALTPKKVWWVSDLLLIAVVALLGLAAAGSAVKRYRHTQALRHFVQDLTYADAAFQSYLREHGKAPPDSDVGVVPPGMAPYLSKLDWTAPTAVGGAYRWVNIPLAAAPAGDPSATGNGSANPPVGTIAITVFGASPPLMLSPADLMEIDRLLDDGNLATGKFRTGFNGWPVLTVEAAP